MTMCVYYHQFELVDRSLMRNNQCETAEEAFKREAMEEAGVRLTKVTLFASQPWPIGRAGSCELMIGCCSDEKEGR